MWKFIGFLRRSWAAKNHIFNLNGVSLTKPNEVIENEWDFPHNRQRLSDDAWAYREIAMEEILSLAEGTSRQQYLKGKLLESIAAVEVERSHREIIAVTDVNILFWIIAFVGLALVAAAYFPFVPNRANVAILAMFSFYTGFVLFFIYVFDNPFSHFGGVAPVSMQIFYEDFLREIVAATPAPLVVGK